MAQAGSFLSAYYIGAAIMSLPAGWMGDRWGVLATMVIGQALISAGLSGVAGSVSFWLLTLIMIVAGAGYGMLNPTTAKAAMAWFPRRQRATAVGFKQVGLPLGGALVAVVGLLTWILYRDPPDSEYAARGTAGGPSLAAVLANRDLWLVALSTLIFAGMQTVWMSFLVLYLTDVLFLPLVQAGGYLVMAQTAGMAGRVLFGVLSDGYFQGRRRVVLVIAGAGSTACSIAMAGTGPSTGAWLLGSLAVTFGFFGIGWNGVQHTLLAELVGPRGAGTAVGLGLTISSFGVSLCPPLFGLAVQRLGGFAVPWAMLGIVMAMNLCFLIPVREGRMELS